MLVNLQQSSTTFWIWFQTNSVIYSKSYFFTTNSYNWMTPLGFLTGKDECNWPAISYTDQFVTTFNIESNNYLVY